MACEVISSELRLRQVRVAAALLGYLSRHEFMR